MSLLAIRQLAVCEFTTGAKQHSQAHHLQDNLGYTECRLANGRLRTGQRNHFEHASELARHFHFHPASIRVVLSSLAAAAAASADNDDDDDDLSSNWPLLAGTLNDHAV